MASLKEYAQLADQAYAMLQPQSYSEGYKRCQGDG